MPLYKKTTSKAKVKTQSSFISPLISQASKNNIKDLLKDYSKENFPIPTKKKLLEPLINTIPNEINLLDKLKRKSFKDSSKPDVSKTKENWSGKTRDIQQKLKEITPKFANVLNEAIKEASYKKSFDKSNNFSTKRAKSKDLSKTLSDLTSQSPDLFNSSSSSSLQKSNKRLKTESNMTITTKIEISSNTNTDENIFNITRTPDMINLRLSDMVNDCVMKNLRTSQQLSKPDEFNEKNSMKTTINADDIDSLDKTTVDSQMEDESESDAYLRDLLDDVVSTNIALSQEMKEDDSIKNFQTDAEEGGEGNKNKQGNNIQQNLETRKSKLQVNEKKKTEKSQKSIKIVNSQYGEDDLDASLRSLLEDVVNTNIMLSQKMDDDNFLKSPDEKLKGKKSNEEKKGTKELKPDKKNVKTKAELKQVLAKSKSRKVENQKSDNNIKTKSFDRLRALCSEENVENTEQLANSKKQLNENSFKKNKTKNTGKMPKDKIKNNLEKQKAIKVTREKNATNNTNMEKSKEQDEKKIKVKEDKGLGGKKLKRKSLTLSRSRSNYNMEERKKTSCPPKAKNMIFTSKNPKTNEMDLKKLLELQEERDVGLYVYCDTCDKVRYLPQCKDPLELPAKWYCYMNPDSNYNKCSDPDFEIESEKEEIIIHNKYNAGSIVWAKMDGYPWWPAMVDDDPDLTDYFWLDEEDSLEPSWYHVTFFDSSEVTRAWIRTANLAPFAINAKNPLFKPKRYDRYRSRVDAAVRDAKTAGKKGILERLRTYSFVVRYLKKRNGTKKGEKRSRTSKNIDMAKNNGNLVDNKKKDDLIKQDDTNKNIISVDDEFCDNLSVASSKIISDILNPGQNKVASDEEILESIDLNHFICNEESFDEF